jgi:hypothetical protein
MPARRAGHSFRRVARQAGKVFQFGISHEVNRFFAALTLLEMRWDPQYDRLSKNALEFANCSKAQRPLVNEFMKK